MYKFFCIIKLVLVLFVTPGSSLVAVTHIIIFDDDNNNVSSFAHFVTLKTPTFLVICWDLAVLLSFV